LNASDLDGFECVEVRRPWPPLPEEAVGVFVRSPLPRAGPVADEHVEAGCGCEVFVASDLFALIHVRVLTSGSAMALNTASSASFKASIVRLPGSFTSTV